VPAQRLEIADIFRDYGAAFRRDNAGHLNRDQLKVMGAIEACRTAKLGGHVALCAKCGHDHVAYNSCRNRHCPKCQGAASRDWMEKRAADLLPVPYYHVVFTMPVEIARIAYQNKAAVYNLLFKARAETLLTIAADPKHLGARVGMTSVLHTWGSAMTHHPHVHMIVAGGGLSADGTKWITCRKNFFLSVRVLSSLYRRLILEGLAKLHHAGKLQFFGDHAELADKANFEAFLKPLRKIDWVVYAKEPFAGPNAVLAYLSRYTHRIAISNSRLTRVDAQGVTFKVKDYRINGPGRFKTMGFMGNGSRATNVAKIRGLLDAKAPDQREDETANGTDEQSRVLALPCPCCGGRLIIIECLPRSCLPREPPDPQKATT